MRKVEKTDGASLSPEGCFRRFYRAGISLSFCVGLTLWSAVASAQGAPEISVVPEDAVVFGGKSVNSRHHRSVVVKNIGSALLEVTDVVLMPTMSNFEIFSGGEPIAIAPAAEVSIDIIYEPTLIQEDRAQLIIESNDADEPKVTLVLSGFGVLEPRPEIQVTPLALEFGQVFIGASNAMNVRITNTGTARLRVMSIELGAETSGDFAITGFSQPISLVLGASVLTEVTYRPLDEGNDIGTLVIESDDEEEPVVTVSLAGAGAPMPVPQIQVTPTAIDFMEVFLGTSSPMSVEITNTGTAPLELSRLELGPGTSDDFAITGPSGSVSVPPGASLTTEVTYSPADEGADSGTLVIESNDTSHPVFTVSLVGVGVPVPAPQIRVTPTAVDFDEVFIDSSSPLSIEIANIGTAPLEVMTIALGPDTSDDFAITGFAQPISLVPGASVTSEVTYSPTDEGADSGTFLIDSNDAGQPQVIVSLSGSGVPAPVPQIQVTAPLDLNYGTVFIGASSAMPVGIGNIGTAPLEIVSIELGPDTSGDFSVTGFSSSISLEPGASVTTEVTYSPSDEGSDNGTLVINSNDAEQPVIKVSLTGSGVPVPVPRIRVTPASLEFADVFISGSRSMTVEIANIGTAPLEISSIHLGPGSSSDLDLTGFDQKIILVPDASVETEITYTPSDEGADSGTLVIESDDAEQPVSVVSLTGVGVPVPMPHIEVRPPALVFDQVQIGSESTQRVTIGNSGMTALEVSFIGLGAETHGEFLITGGAESADVLPGEEVAVDVTYAPSDEGADSGTLRIESNDADDPILNVSLSGTGVPAPVPQIVVAPPSLVFGEVSVGSSSSLTVTISNTGTASLEVASITLGVATSADFAITGGSGSASLAPGEETVVEVTYTPIDEAPDSGTLRIESNDAEDPLLTVSLFGTGVSIDDHFRRGDSNTDGVVDVGDAITTIGFLFRGESKPACFDAADSNDDGSLNLSDGIFTLSWLFNGGPASPPPGNGDCGEDLTEDGLSACVYPQELCGI